MDRQSICGVEKYGAQRFLEELQAPRLAGLGELLPKQVDRWDLDYFYRLGLYQLCGTVRHPEQSILMEAA